MWRHGYGIEMAIKANKTIRLPIRRCGAGPPSLRPAPSLPWKSWQVEIPFGSSFFGDLIYGLAAASAASCGSFSHVRDGFSLRAFLKFL